MRGPAVPKAGRADGERRGGGVSHCFLLIYGTCRPTGGYGTHAIPMPGHPFRAA